MMASLEDLIPTVNKLQDVMYASGIEAMNLPILAVVGSQSSGKSSILETLVGRDFLPRGNGIVTRRPLILQLINTSPESPSPSITPPLSKSNSSRSDDSDEFVDPKEDFTSQLKNRPHYRNNTIRSEEWGVFLHKPDEKFYDFQEIRKEIELETVRIAGKNKGISKIPISLKIFSPYVLNLTLVDLPGITKVPIGEQPHDIERQINNLILDFVATPNCLILAVSPANIDIANSESLKLAKEVDPHGLRTIGVLTKLDLMDSGTNAIDILMGKVYPLKLGFIGVVNRSQQDIQENVTVKEALDNEDAYFKRHPIYRRIANRCGTRFLAKLLNKTLMDHIRDKLPDIKVRLNSLINQMEKLLLSFGDPSMFDGYENKSGLVLQLINTFATNFIASIDGTSSNINTKELCGGARIYYIYNNIFGRTLKSVDPTANLSKNAIRTAIRNSTGPRATLFVPELAFDLLVKPQIKLLVGPSQHCVELVFEELIKICNKSGSYELSRYPNLKNILIDVVSELLRERLEPTHSYVESLISIHTAYINTNHPRFLGATEVMSDILNERDRKKNESMKKPMALNDISQNYKNADSISVSSIPLTKNDIPNVGNNLNTMIDEALSKSTSNLNLNGKNIHNTEKESFLDYFFGQDRDRLLNKAINSKIPDYKNIDSSIINDVSMPNVVQNDTNMEPDATLSEREELECELIKRLIISYFDIVREMVEDQVPKAIMHLLVNFCKENVQNRLVKELYKESMMNDLLKEDDTLVQERFNCEQLLNTYKKASSIINNIL